MVSAQDIRADCEDALKMVQEEHDWYDRRIWRYRVGTWVVRIIAGITLLLGILLPLTNSTQPVTLWWLTFAGPAQAGYAALAAGGLALLADQVFMFSGTWRRYSDSMMKIKTLRALSEKDVSSYLRKLSDPISPEDVTSGDFLCRSMIASARGIVEAETSAWSSDLSASIEQLRALTTEQGAAVRALADEEKRIRTAAVDLANSAKTCSVRVALRGDAGRLVGKFKIHVGECEEEREVPQSQVVVSSVASGIQQVWLSGRDGAGERVYAENSVAAAPNTIVDVQLAIPEIKS